MPRKVTKTMREARKRAAQQKAERRKYKEACDQVDFKWGSCTGRIGDSTLELHNVRAGVRVQRKVAKDRPTKSDSDSVFLDIDFGSFEESMLESEPKKPKTTTGRFSSKAFSRCNIPKTMSEEEYKAREAAAALEIERKKSCIAPAYNKGAYQYIASPEAAKDAGKKQ